MPRRQSKPDQDELEDEEPAGPCFTPEEVVEQERAKRAAEVVDQWWYRNRDGEGVLLRFRLEASDCNVTLQAVMHGDDQWVTGWPADKKVPLYRAYEVGELPIFVVQGELAVDAAIAMGLSAVTSAGGPEDVERSDWQPTAGRPVIIAPTNSDDGRAYARAVARRVLGLGPPAVVRMLALPGLDALDLPIAARIIRATTCRRNVSEAGRVPIVFESDTIVSDMDTPTVDDLGAVLLGRTRGAVLGLLLGRPDEEFHVRQVARLSGATLGPVQRELKLLARVGVLKCREVGNQLLYRADPASPVHEELRGLIVKTVGLADVLKAALRTAAGQIRVAFLFGSFARGQQHAASDVDLMVIGDTSVANLAKALAGPQRRLGREINPAIYRAAEFAAKLRDGHHFLNAVMAGPKVFLIGDEHELSRVAEERVAPAPPNQPTGNRRTDRRRRAGLGHQR